MTEKSPSTFALKLLFDKLYLKMFTDLCVILSLDKLLWLRFGVKTTILSVEKI